MDKQGESFQINQLADYMKAELLRRQAEIEQQTGHKPSLEDLFVQIKQELFQKFIPGQQQVDDGTPPAYELKMPGALPGIRKSTFHTCFVPDLPLISHWKRAASVFYAGYSQEETEKLHKLYLDPRFQRLSNTLEGRMAIINNIEGTDYKIFPKQFSSYPEYYGSLEHELNQPPDNYGELANIFIRQHSEKYGLKWLVHNEPPLPKVFLDPKWLSGAALIDCWWKYVAQPVAEEFNIPAIASLSAQHVNKQLEWATSLPKFQKLSRTLFGRMDLICSMERIPKQRMMQYLEIGNEHLMNYKEHEELIRENLTESFGMSYGNVWVAYGFAGGTDYRLVYYALDSKFRFLDRVPALFRDSRSRRFVTDENENNGNEELSGTQRTCLNCGSPIEGRSDKRFCDGACQRTYYNRNYKRSETLNGHTHEQQQTAKPEEKEETGLMGVVSQIMKGPSGIFMTKLAENAAESLSEKMFGKKTEPSSTQKPEQNNPPPPKVKIVTGEEIMKRQFETGLPAFTPEFTKFFGNLHFPFRMLVWGLPGQGKSSFCIKFCNALAIAQLPGTYISAEEDPEGDTMQDKIYQNWRGKLTMKFTTALPQTQEQLHDLLLRKDEKGRDRLNSFYIVYDSVSKMEQKPGLADRVQNLFGDNLNEIVSHIYIAHAEKDGSTYQGDADWEYEADIVISVDNVGVATMRKNRFKTATEGLIGGTFNFFGWKIAGRTPFE